MYVTKQTIQRGRQMIPPGTSIDFDDAAEAERLVARGVLAVPDAEAPARPEHSSPRERAGAAARVPDDYAALNVFRAIERIDATEDVAQLQAIDAAERARERGPRSSVLAAVADRIAELERGDEE